jgi:phospholipid/cholesterol/gamma-HCH transport system substrate-binding protein
LTKKVAVLKISREAKIGLFAAVSLAALYFGYNFLRGKKIFSPLVTYYVVYNKIDGVVKSTPIYFKGLKVGQVEKLELFRTDSANLILVTLNIDKKIQLSRSSEARIVSMDLLGGKAISLIIPSLVDPIKSKDTLIGSIESTLSASISEMITPVKNKTENVLVSLDHVLAELEKVLDQGGTQNLSASTKDLAAIMKNLSEMSATLNRVVKSQEGNANRMADNLESITGNIRKSNQDIAASLKNMNQLSDSLANAPLKSTIEQLNKTSAELAQLSASLNDGKGTAGKLLKDEALYNNLTQTTESLNALLKDLKENPKRYVNVSVFGGKDKKKK